MTKTNTAKETFHCVKFLSYRSTFTSSILSLTKMSSLFPPFFPRPFPQFHPPTLVHESRHPRRDDTPRCAHADPHLSPRMTSPVVELLRRDKYTLGVGHEAFSNGRTKLPLVNNNHRRVSLSRIVRSIHGEERNYVQRSGMKISVVSLSSSLNRRRLRR